ncbi:hypothetical protein [Shewanella benthica]|nr:hypothetical protein [Shewanella benthica]
MPLKLKIARKVNDKLVDNYTDKAFIETNFSSVTRKISESE